MPKKTVHSKPLVWSDVVCLGSKLPEVEESTSYGTPALKVRKKLFVRVHQDDEDVVVVKMEHPERAMRMTADPSAFFITDHYFTHPWVLVRLSAVGEADFHEALIDAWKLAAPKRLVAAFEAE